MKKIVLPVLVILAMMLLTSGFPTLWRRGHRLRHSIRKLHGRNWAELSWKLGTKILNLRFHNKNRDYSKTNVKTTAKKNKPGRTLWNRQEVLLTGRPRAIDGMKYLQQFGYMKYVKSPQAVAIEGGSPQNAYGQDNSMSEAIKGFQRVAHIEQTGILDEATLNMMEKPRCGVPDDKIFENKTRKKRHRAHSSKWEKTEITYNISRFTKDLNQAVVENDIADALNFWARVTPLTFTKVDQGPVDIDIYFAHSDHGDGKPFDGKGGVLAHAFFPSGAVEFDIAGDTHFDEGENWTHGEYRGANLLYAAVHQFGHALGLDHSDQFSSVMFPFGRSYDPNLKLYQDDIDGIQSLYGANTAPPEPIPTVLISESTTTDSDAEITTKPSPSTIQTPTAHPSPKHNDTTKPDNDPTTAAPEAENCVNTMDAITVTLLGDTVAFRGSQIYLLSVSHYGVQEGYPKPISAMFPDGPEAVDAALTFPHYNEGKKYKVGEQSYTWLFKGDKSWKYKLNVGMSMVLETGYPKYIYVDWDGLSTERIDSAFSCTGNIYFTKASEARIQEASKISQDGRCGPMFNDMECPVDTPPPWDSMVTPCCSFIGFCGITSDHCTTGIDYRERYNDTAQDPTMVSVDGRCGPMFNDLECPIGNRVSGWESMRYPCCSHSGWCGNMDAHCRGIDYRNKYNANGSLYWKYNGPSGKLLNGYPKSISSLSILKRAGIREVDAAFQWINDRIYFFKDGQYYKYEQENGNVIGPKDTGKYWFGCPDEQ